MNLNDAIKAHGEVECKISYKNRKQLKWNFPNTVVLTGRQGMAQALTNTLGASQTSQIYIQYMVFGTNGLDGSDNPKIVTPDQNSLFGGAPVASKPVNTAVDGSLPSQAIFSSTLLYDDCVGSELSVMGLLMANGNYYSIVTFPKLTKTDSMQIDWVWKINFV